METEVYFIDENGIKWELVNETDTYCEYQAVQKIYKAGKEPFNGALPPDDYQISN